MKKKWTAVLLAMLLGASCQESSTARKDGSEEKKAAESRPAGESQGGFFDRLLSKPRPKVTVPSGTQLGLKLETALSTESAQPGDSFTTRTTAALLVEGKVALPAGSRVEGHVSRAVAAGKVKGRAEITLEFDRVVTPDGEEAALEAEPYHQVARSTVKKDATIIGGGAGAGALVGGLIGGKKGAGIGAAVGGAAGTGAVLSLGGEEVVLREGATLSTRLRVPLTILAPET